MEAHVRLNFDKYAKFNNEVDKLLDLSRSIQSQQEKSPQDRVDVDP